MPFSFSSVTGLMFGLVLATSSVSTIYAQVDSGAILGTVFDSSGAVVPQAKISVVNEATSVTRSSETRSDGTFTFTPLEIGSYSVAAEATGFQKVTQTHIKLDIQQQVVINFTLKPGELSQNVEVTGVAPLLQTQNASIGQVVGARQINDLPLNGRNYVFLAQLSAGVTVAQQDNLGNSGTTGMAATGSFSANGTRPSENNYMLDGMDNNNRQQDVQGGSFFTVRPPVDALQEFKIQTSNYSAEFGLAAGAVLNAAVKSGGTRLHGDIWEFLRNDKFDAADFFENAAGQSKGEFRLNQLGGTLGGPLPLPKLTNDTRKAFFFLDYEGTRIRQGIPMVLTVPTAAERNSGFTDLSDLIANQSGSTPKDLLGRSFPMGTVFDPATTRIVTSGVEDPITGLVSKGNGYVRDPFHGNRIPISRLDPNAIKLLDLYPLPTGSSLLDNYTTSPRKESNVNSFDIRGDYYAGTHDQMFIRSSYSNAANYNPVPFVGVASGGDFFSGEVPIVASSNVIGETHIFSPVLVNEVRLGYNRYYNIISQTNLNDLGIPESFGIQGIPQYPGNGGLPTLNITGLSQLGAPGYQPTYKVSNVANLVDNLTIVAGSHTIKTGFAYQYVFVPFLVPPTSRGSFTFSGDYTSIPGANVGSTGRAQFLLTPTSTLVANGIDNVGGASTVAASSSISSTQVMEYYAGYVQDDWKITRNMTLNLGMRYEYFSPVKDRYNNVANFLPGEPFSGAEYLFPRSRPDALSSSFLGVLAQDGIQLQRSANVTGSTPKNDFAPRFGFAYQVNPKFVVRGGYGISYSGMETLGGVSHQWSFNFPFLFSYRFPEPDPAHPITPNNYIGLLENGLLNVPLTASFATAAQGFRITGLELHPSTPYEQSANFSLQYQLSANQSLQVAYVGTLGRHLAVSSGANNVQKILPPLAKPQQYVPFPDLSRGLGYTTYNGNSYFHSLQTTFERRLSAGLSLLADFTWSKCRSDALDPLTPSFNSIYRAPGIAGFGIQGDYGLCAADVRRMLHFSGGYDLPVGRGRHFLSSAPGIVDKLLGGWSVNWILTLQDGQPFSIPCTITTAAGVGCYALFIPGQNPYGPSPDQFLNRAAFTNPGIATTVGQSDLGPLGGAANEVTGPPIHRLDFSIFKKFRTSEATSLEFRAEFFNLTNTPDFSIPVNTNFSNPNFGRITSTRDNPNDPREIQFALKFYW